MPSLTVIGDVNIEVVGRTSAPFQRIDRNRLEYGQLELLIGGTAARLAFAACGVFTPVRLLGSIGSDEAGRWAAQTLRSEGIDVRLRCDPGSPTGLVIEVRDGTAGTGTRLLLVQADNANHLLDSSHILANFDCLGKTDFLMTDGYSLIRDPRRQATLQAMRMAAQAGAKVAVDIVPHDCYERMNLAELHDWLSCATISIVEVTTIRRFLALACPELVGLPVALDTAIALAAEFPAHSFLLRFGVSNSEQSLVCRPGKKPVHRFTGVHEALPSGHLQADVATVRELSRFF